VNPQSRAEREPVGDGHIDAHDAQHQFLAPGVEAVARIKRIAREHDRGRTPRFAIVRRHPLSAPPVASRAAGESRGGLLRVAALWAIRRFVEQRAVWPCASQAAPALTRPHRDATRDGIDSDITLVNYPSDYLASRPLLKMK
jgi:hypothetical protein